MGDVAAQAQAVAQEGDAPAPTWVAAENTLDRTNVFRGYKAEYLSCRFLSHEAGLRTGDVVLELDGRKQPILVLANLGNGEWQLNATLPADWRPGATRCGFARSVAGLHEPADIFYDPANVIQP